MSMLRNSMQHHDALTKNEAITHSTSGSRCLDFFFKAGGMRGKDVVPLFNLAYSENPDLAIRIALWLRDVRGGAGERQLFRDIFFSLGKYVPDVAVQLLPKIVELGRWDDLFSFHENIQNDVISFYADAIERGDALACKWAPREKSSGRILAFLLREELGYSRRDYRRLLALNSETVEQDMSANRWQFIKYPHVPSQAMAKYRRAFSRHDAERFVEFLDDIKKGKTKINAAAIHPHEIIGKYIDDTVTAIGQYYYCKSKAIYNKAENDAIEAQWNALPNYVTEESGSTLCICDTSGSMRGLPIRVAVALSIYFAERNKGEFHNEFITFSAAPSFQYLEGKTLQDKVHNLLKTKWGQNTNLHYVFNMLLSRAVEANIPQEQMPKNLIIISDMEFDRATSNNKITNYEKIKKIYKNSGYEFPRIIFWNVNSIQIGNFPVRQHDTGTSLVSGFSPSIFHSIMKGGLSTPESIMHEIVMNQRYDWQDNDEPL